MIIDSKTIGLDAFPKYDVYNLAFSNISSKACLSILDGNCFLNGDQSNFSISSSCLKEGIVRPMY